MKKLLKIGVWIPGINIVILLGFAAKYVLSKEQENMLFVVAIWAGIVISAAALVTLWEFISRGINWIIVDSVKVVILSALFSVGAFLAVRKENRISR